MSESLIELIVVTACFLGIFFVLVVIAKVMGVYSDPIKKSRNLIEKSKKNNAIFIQSINNVKIINKIISIKKNLKILTIMHRYLQAFAYDNKCEIETGTVVSLFKKLNIAYRRVINLEKDKNHVNVLPCFKVIDDVYLELLTQIDILVEIANSKKANQQSF